MKLEYLRHGKSLCGKVFRRFVETFNFHNDFISNLKGDADLQVVGGKVHLDRTDERNPVIRCQVFGNGGCASAARLPGCFEIRRPTEGEDDEGGDSGGFDNPYMLIGGRPFYMAGAISGGFDYENCIVAVCLDVTSETPQPYIEEFADFLAMVEAVKSDPSLAVHPLYQLGEGGAVVCDMRTIPTITSWEYGT